MSDGGAVFQVFRHEEISDSEAEQTDELLPRLPGGRLRPDDYVTHTLVFSAGFVGANDARPMGLEQSETVFNYFVGDEGTWHAEVPGYEVVAYEGLYDGIDLHTWGLRSSLKYEFHVAPGADWSQIAVRYDGIAGLSLSEDGSLAIDLGGSDWDWGYGIAVDAAGNSLVVGLTASTDFSGVTNCTTEANMTPLWLRSPLPRTVSLPRKSRGGWTMAVDTWRPARASRSTRSIGGFGAPGHGPT